MPRFTAARRVVTLAACGLALLSVIPSWSAAACPGTKTFVAAGQTLMRVDEGVVPIASLDEERRACLVTLSVDAESAPGTLVLEPGVEELLHRRLEPRPQIVTLANYGPHVAITKNGEAMAPLRPGDAHLALRYEPGDVLTLRSETERLALPLRTLPARELAGLAAQLAGRPFLDDPALLEATRVEGLLRFESPELGVGGSGALALRVELDGAHPAESGGFAELLVLAGGQRATLALLDGSAYGGDARSVRLGALLPLASLGDPQSLRVILRYSDGSPAPDATLREIRVASLRAPGPARLGPAPFRDAIEEESTEGPASEGRDAESSTAASPAPAPSRETTTRATGLLPPTPDEQAWMQEHMVRTGRVRFNALGLKRLEDAGAYVPRELAPVAVGREVEPESALPMSIQSGDTPVGLPLAVDNSTLPYFPPIDTQGSQGSCAAFSSTYYVMTHMHCLARGCDAKSGGRAIAFSPAFTYNLINGGADAGSWFSSAYGVMESHGAPTWNEFPYDAWSSDPLRHLRWPTDFETWRAALDRRIDATGTIYGVDTPTGLDQLKQLLVNGYVLNYATYVNSWVYGSVGDDPSTSEDDAFVGEEIVSHVAGSSGAHGMTVVGYDDRIWLDLNGNGSVDAGEKGALRIANSWGYWKDAGFTWIAYDALQPATAVAGGPAPANRDGAFWYEQAYWITARSSYAPTAVAEVTLSHARRNEVYLRLGQGQPGSYTIEEWFYPWGPNGDGGAYAFDGSSGAAVSATFALDFTDLAEEDVERSWFLYAQDSTASSPLEVAGFALHDQLGRRKERATSVPLSLDAESAEIKLEHALDATPSASLTPGEPLESWLRAAEQPHAECSVFELTLACGAGTLDVVVNGLDGDADLVVLHESKGDPCAAPAAAACHVDVAGLGDESCAVDLPGPGRWLAAVRNVDVSQEIDFSITASVVDTTTPRPVADLRVAKTDPASALDLAWTRPAACGTRAAADGYAIHETLWGPGASGPSFPAASDTLDTTLESVAHTLAATATPASGQVYVVTVIAENAAGPGEALP